MGWGRRNGPGVGVMGVESGWGAEGCRGRRVWGGGCSWRGGVRGHETARVLGVDGEGGMPAGARLRSRLILRASRKARLPAVPATGLQPSAGSISGAHLSMPFENSAGLTLPERCKEKRAQWGETPLRLLLHLCVHLLQRACALHKRRL